MGRNQNADKTTKEKGSKMEVYGRRSKGKKEQGVLIEPSSSTESLSKEIEEENEDLSEEVEEDDVVEMIEDDAEKVEDVEMEEEEVELKRSDVKSPRSNKKENAKKNEKSKKKAKKSKEVDAEDKKNGNALYSIPMNRISRIIKGENPDFRLSQEAVFVINKASEKFLELLCKEAYACTSRDRKKKVYYKHLSSVISKKSRYDFLSDFVPEQVTAAEALKEVPSASMET